MPSRAVERRLLVVRGRVEALEARVAVVVAVGGVPVADEVARDLDLVRRVVREVPGVRRLAEPDLEQRGGHEQHSADNDRERDREPAGPGPDPPGRSGDEGDDEARQDRRRAEDAEVPLAVGGADERSEEPAWVHRGRHEGPRVRAELRDRDRDEHAQRRQQQPRAVAIHGSSMASLRDSMYDAATAMTSQVTGSSKNPLYARECTKRAKNTAPRPSPSGGARRRTRSISTAAPPSSHRYAASPITPSSAATVSGVVCETKRVGDPPCFERAWLATGWLPRPTPAVGCARKTFQVSSTRRERSLVNRRAEWSRTELTRIPAAPSSTTTAVTAATSFRLRFPATAASTRVTTNNDAMLDCEYENQSPTKSTAISPVARNGFTFP